MALYPINSHPQSLLRTPEELCSSLFEIFSDIQWHSKKIYPENYQINQIHANQLTLAGKFSEAERIYRILIEKAPYSHEAYQGLFECYQRQNNLDLLIQDFEKMALQHTERIQAHNFLAFAYQATGQYEEATKVLKFLCKLTPDDISRKARLADSYRQANKPDLAKKVYAELLFAAPESVAFAENFMSLHDDREIETLIEFWSNLASARHDAALPLWYLGKSLLRAGYDEKAQEAFSRARAINPAITTSNYDTTTQQTWQ